MCRELSIIEIQECQLQMLKHLHRICVENNISYFLYGGTLLGAIRHNGFIPWDDDTDVIVPREDYSRLLSLLREDGTYPLLSYEYVSDYYYPFAKLVDPTTRLVENGVRNCSQMGVWLDIFPLDSFSDKELLGKFISG